MQPLAAQSPSPARAPGKEACNAERAVNLVRTFPGLHEVAADLASQPPLAARSPSPEMQAPPAPPASPEPPERAPGTEAGNAERAVNLVRTFPGLPEVAADLASQQPPAPPPAVGLRRIPWPEDQSWNAFQTAHAGGGRKNRADLINARHALAATRPPPATTEDAGRACTHGGDDDDAGEDVFYWFYRQPRKRRPADASSMQARKHDDALPQQQPRKRGRPAGKGARLKAGASRPACAAPSFLQEPLPAVKQPPLPQPSFQPPPSLHPLPRSDLWTIVDMHELG